MGSAGQKFLQRLANLYTKEIWRPENLKDRSLRGRSYALLRIVSITLTGVRETKAISRAAALSFSSLLGLGPLVAIAVLVAGFVLDRSDPDLAVNTLNRVIKFIAPQVSEYEKALHNGEPPVPPERQADVASSVTRNLPREVRSDVPLSPPLDAPPGEGVATGAADPDAVPVNPELVELIDGFIDGSKSSTAGIIGIVTLIVIVLQLFTSIENAFNEIWGVHQGRTWIMRIVYYWTVITLGAVLFFGIVTALSAGAYLNFFAERIPFGLGTAFLNVLQWALPSISLSALVALLTLFYRFIPNTRVMWRAAFAGALVVAALILANNYLAFLYLSRVMQQKSLFGSLGILPILMFGLYIFWLFLLLGGQLSYAVQNVHFRNSQAAWDSLAESMRERLSLAVLLDAGRRFAACQPPITPTELGTHLRVPTQILNECINRLVRMKLLSPVPPEEAKSGAEMRYQPARPLNRITMGDFKHLDDTFGGDPQGPSLANLDPVLALYNRAVAESTSSGIFTQTLEELIQAHPIPVTGR